MGKDNGSILIVSKDNLHLTKMCVKSALAQTYKCDVMVLDNMSGDGTRDWLKTKDVLRISPPFEGSVAACWNRGIEAFWKLGAEEVLVLNNDVVIRPDFYALLKPFPGPFVTGVAVDTKEAADAPRTLDYLMTSANPNPCFSAFMIRKETWDKVGPFDITYFPAYCEDSSYHVEMHRWGIKAYSIDLPFLHLGSQTFKNAECRRRDWIGRMADRNREKFRQRYGCLPGDQDYPELFTERSFGMYLRGAK